MERKKEVDDRFKRFGTVGFTAVSRSNDFIDYLAHGRVMGTRCRDCRRSFFPPRADCCHCLTSRMDWFEVTGTGRLVTFSRLNFAPIGFEADVPYFIALLDYDAFKIFGRIDGDLPANEIQVGMQMKTVARRLAGDRLTYVFQKA